jgi:hypothetical protein
MINTIIIRNITTTINKYIQRKDFLNGVMPKYLLNTMVLVKAAYIEL